MKAQPNGCLSELPNDYVSKLPNELTEMLKGVVLPEMSGTLEQCIYKVPQTVRQVNPQAYTPQHISIGPFHSPLGSNSDDNNLQEMEELKLKYLKGFLNRTPYVSVDELFSKVQVLENKIRNCYAGIVRFNSKDFLKIIIVDACFIIEHFLRYAYYNSWKENDPILLKPWLFTEINYDLILLENQLPFFVHEEIYKLANINLQHPSFISITIHYFMEDNLQSLNSRHFTRSKLPEHFTDLLRTFFIPTSFEEEKIGNTIENVYSVSQLSEAGLVFEVSESKCLLDWKFDKGVFKIPCFQIHDDTEKYMRNMLAFELCHINSSSRYICQYLNILDFLINTEKDVSILFDKKIIVNWMSDANEVATMVNKLCKNITMPKFNSKYISLCHELNGFYENPRNKYKAIFVGEYFNTPWKIASTITAILLVLFTLIQAVCSIWSLVK